MNLFCKSAVCMYLFGMILVTSAFAYRANPGDPEKHLVAQASVCDPETGETVEVPVSLNYETMTTRAVDENTNVATIDTEVKVADILSKTRASQSISDLDHSASVRGQMTLTYSYQNGNKNYVRLDKVAGSFTSSIDRVHISDTTVSPGQCATNVSDSDMVGTSVPNTYSVKTGFQRYIPVLDPMAVVGAYAVTQIDYRQSSWEYELELYIVDNWGGGLGDLIGGR